MKNLQQQPGYARPASLLTRILRALGQAGVIIGCTFYFYGVAFWDTVIRGKAADEQEGGK